MPLFLRVWSKSSILRFAGKIGYWAVWFIYLPFSSCICYLVRLFANKIGKLSRYKSKIRKKAALYF